MIRTKAKSLLLSIMLVMACFVFFACKEEAKVKVESIAFTEQSIELLVGEEYTPQIKILPSYATDRSYTLVSSDTTALKVEAGTITALKSTGKNSSVILKVVSNDDDNVNDAIAVRIYDEATELDVPTELKFDGTDFTFVGKDNVEAYVLKINGQEINIGNNIEYAFNNVIGKVDGLFNNIVTCSVKAVGDGKIFKDSPYSQEIRFVKLANVNNAYIENEKLYFEAIENVESYNVDVLIDGQVDQNRIVNNGTFEAKQLSLDIANLTDSVNGAEYTICITPNIENYNTEEGVDVFEGTSTELDYVVVGSVQNLIINDKIISWDFVKNAQSYTIEVYKEGELLQKHENIVNNYLQLPYDIAGEYYCQVLANSTNLNTTTGKTYSSPLYFNILTSPEIIADQNTITWTDTAGAEGYLVTIKDSAGSTVINRTFVLDNSYDVSGFGAGTYYIEVVACGNGENGKNGQVLLSSTTSQQISWTILEGLQLKVENQRLYWQDIDSNSLNKYRVMFDDVDVTLTEADYGEQYEYNEALNWFSYDLSNYNFEPNAYTISVQSLGENSIFDSNKNNTNIIKLSEGSISALTNKKFTINVVSNASSYKIEIYKSSDLNNVLITLDSMLSGNKFGLDTTLLEAGNYVAKVFVYGNGSNVFDADNLNEGTTLSFQKLAIPTITINSEDLKLEVEQISNANKYNLFENSRNKNIDNREYSLSGLTAGDYVYTAQAVGDNAAVLDSDLTAVENQIKIKKLATPTITFDKINLTYTISCADEDFVTGYAFSLNDENVIVSNNQANGSSLITTAQTYEAEVYAKPLTVSAGYNLVIKSDTQTHSISKLEGLCDFQISNGKLIVTPSVVLTGGGYSLELRIENGENDIVLSDFTYSNSRFETSLYDSKYNAINEIVSLLQTSGEYEVFTTISQSNAYVVSSNEIKAQSVLKILGKVSSVSKNNQTIEFDTVDNATNYIAIITLNDVEYYIDLTEKYTTNTNNVVNMSDLLQLMSLKAVPYLENTPYTIKFVAISSDTRTLANKGVNSYSFEFLKAPALSIIEQDGDTKYLSIANDDRNSSSYSLVISQDMVVSEGPISKQMGDNTTINMDEIDELVAGNVRIMVYAKASSGNYFDSQNSELNVIKLNSPEIKISNGLLEWNAINNVKQYNLTYSNSISSGTIVLTDGVENFTTQGGKCIYNFDTLESNLTSLYLQVDSLLQVGGTYYLNSNNGPTFEDVYKLPTLEIKVINGQVYTEIRNSDLELIQKVEVKVNDRVLGVDITKAQGGDITLTPSVDKLGITIAPGVLFSYGEKELLLETLSLKMYSNNATTLNSSIVEKDIYGLLTPTGLDITTSATPNANGVVEDVFEKITWQNPTPNANYVVKYEIVINYNDVDYVFNCVERAFMMPTYYDANNNGSLDEGEVEFGSGTYTIKVRALTDNCENIVNSRYCGTISVMVLETPTGLSTKDGNIIWTNDSSVGYYLVKVYLINGNSKQIIVSSQASVSEFDLTTLTPFETGVYGVSVQAMHNNSRILSSKESNIFQVVRLPQVEKYYIKNGELHVIMHSFYSKAEIYLTDKQTGTITHTFTMLNEASNDNVKEYVQDGLYMTWAKSNIISTYTNDNYFVDVKYNVEGDATLRAALAQAYNLSVKLYGNTLPGDLLPEGVSIGGIISGHTSELAINKYWEDDNGVVDKNVVEKLVTPSVEVSSTERGVMLVNIPNGLNYSLNYYVNGGKALQGVHLYEVNISTNNKYTIYVAEVVDVELLKNSLTAVGSELIQDNEDRNNLKHFTYNGITFNIIDQNAEGYIPFNFKTNHYYYYSTDGIYTYIDLTVGGSFVVSVRFMGDDSCFVQSNLTDTVTIKRYSVLNLTINNGVISWLNQASADDHPIYLINLSNETENFNLVLYNPEVHDKEQIKKCLEAGKTYMFDTITYAINAEVEDAVITYKGLADLIDQARKDMSSALVGKGGTFLATIKAHYTDSTSMDIILAQDGESKTISVLPQSQVSVVDGALSWAMSYVTNSGGREYIYKYLLQVFNAENKLYEITLNEGGYNVVNDIVTYQLPKTLNNGGDGEFNFNSDLNYVFKIVALGGEGKTYVNSVATSTGEIDLLPELQNVRMENGKLVWSNPSTNSVEVYVSYTLGDATVTCIIMETDNVFELPESFVDTNQTLRYLVTGYDYHIKVRLKGQTTSLNGFFSDEIVAQRLATITTDSIITNNGVLTWKADSLDGVKYSVTYKLADGSTGETELLETNMFDFAGLKDGVIETNVFAHHNDHFTSFVSEKVDLFKLSVPTNIKYHEGSTTISWDKVVDKDGNPVDTYMVRVQQDGVETQEYKCVTNEWIITGVTSNKFSIAVMAINTSERAFIINSDYTEYQSMEVPHQVDVITYNDQLKAFIWEPIVGEQDGDKYYIGYEYYEIILTAGDKSTPPTPIDRVQVTKMREIEGKMYYVFYPSAIGSYRMIYVQVERLESLSSQQTFCMIDEDTYYELDFDLFTSGDGTVDKPYIISNERHLRNIKYFLDANYELDDDIDLTSGDPITDSTQIFTGTINGNEHYIGGIGRAEEGLLNESGYIGLFNRVRGATFANITLSNFSLKGYVNSATLYMGILVGYAEGNTVNGQVVTSKFQNIKITSSTIELTKNSTTGYTGSSVDMYVGAIVGYAINCEFAGCVVSLGGENANVIADIEGNSQTKLSFGAITGFANNCTLNSNTSNETNAFIISTISRPTGGQPVVYVGSLVGEAGNSGVTSNNNSYMYAEKTSQGLTQKTNEIGN